MKIKNICCQGCGAALGIEDSLRFVTCNYCHARLEVVHDPTVTHTRLLEKLERHSDQLVDEMKMLRFQNDLEQLDREWLDYRKSTFPCRPNGTPVEPSVGGSVMGGIMVIVVGLVFAAFSFCASYLFGGVIGSPFAFFGVVGLVVVFFGFRTIIVGSSRAQVFENFRMSYQMRRADLVNRMEEHRTAQR